MILLDTNVVIHFNKRTSKLLQQRMLSALEAQDAEVFLPTMVFHELKLGALRHAFEERGQMKLETFLDRISGVLQLTEDDAAIAAEVRYKLQATGQMIGAYDLLIASQALCRDALLVTNNTREFSRVPGLRWTDWMAED